MNSEAESDSGPRESEVPSRRMTTADLAPEYSATVLTASERQRKGVNIVAIVGSQAETAPEESR